MFSFRWLHPKAKSIQRLHLDGSDFSGDYVLLDDLAFVTHDEPSKPADLVGRETPSWREPPACEVHSRQRFSQRQRSPTSRRSIAVLQAERRGNVFAIS